MFTVKSIEKNKEKATNAFSGEMCEI